MKRLFSTICALACCAPLFAQLYQPGEVLDYRVSYKAKMFPNTEVGSVRMTTEEVEEQGRKYYKVVGLGRTLPTYRWFFNLEDTYTVHVDPQTLRPVRFESDIREGDYTFASTYDYDWERSEVRTRWHKRKNPEKSRTLTLTPESMDAISLFYNLRAASAEDFEAGEPRVLQMVLEDTIRHLRYRYLGREQKKIRNMGKFKTLKFDCQLGTSEGFSFTDGTVFTIWISDDENKIPLYMESPVRIGSICAYISDYKGLKYPMKSRIR